MEVLLFQIVIAAIIIIVGASGKKERDGITIILVILTLLAVFMTWLIILQLITIAVAYQISSDIEQNRNQKSNQQTYYNQIPNTKSSGNSLKSCFLVFIIFIVISSLIAIFQDMKTEPKELPKVPESNDTITRIPGRKINFISTEPFEDSVVSEIPKDSIQIPKDSIQIPESFNFDEDESGDPQNERVE